MRARRLKPPLAAACAAVAIQVMPLCAADRFWVGPNPGAFESPTNWAPLLPDPPGPLDNAVFDQGIASPGHVVTFASDPINVRLLVRKDSVQFAPFGLDAHTYTLSSATSPGMVVGEITGDNASLTVLPGITLDAQNTAVAQGYTASGRLTIAGGTLRNAAALTVGQSGQGALAINSGGSVTTVSAFIGQATTGVGTCAVSGADSTLSATGPFRVGVSGKGAVSVSAGGILNTGSSVTATNSILGLYAGASGTVSVDGEGSAWRLPYSDLIVGRAGYGELSVGNGGSVAAMSAVIGAQSTGSGQVLISGTSPSGIQSSVTIANTLTIADAGQALVDIQLGGRLASGNTIIGSQDGSDGSVYVSDPGSLWNLGSASLTVAAGGKAAVNVSIDAGVLSGDVTVGQSDTADGQISIDAATWTSTGHFHVGLEGSGYTEVVGGSTLTSVSGAVGVRGVLGVLTNGAPAMAGRSKAGVLLAYVWVHGTGSRWEMTGPLDVGFGREGEIVVEAGGRLASGPATVGNDDDGVGSVWLTLSAAQSSSWAVDGPLIVGYGGYGNGQVIVEDRSRLTSTSGVIGDHDQAVGAVTVSDSGSEWTTGTLDIGVMDASQGFLSVLSGGHLVSGTTSIGGDGAGWGGNGYVTVKGVGAAGWPATWDNTGDLIVGNGGIGNLNIEDGGIVNVNGSAYLGMSSSFTEGVVSLLGASSRLSVGGELVVGLDGVGSLSAWGGTINSGSGAVGAMPGSTGTVDLSQPSSEWSIAGALYIGGDAFGPGGQGLVRVLDGARLRADDGILVYEQGTLEVANPDLSASSIFLLGGLLRGVGNIAPPVGSADGTVLVHDGEMALDGGLVIISSLHKTGPGTLSIIGPQAHASGATLYVDAGEVRMESNAGGMLGTRNLAVKLAAGTVVRFQSTQNLAALDVGNALAELAPASQVIDTDSLKIGPAGKLDLWDNALIVRSTPAARDADLARITAWIRSARNTLPPWQGYGITTSSAPTQPLRGLAVMLNAGGDGLPVHNVFAGQPVDENCILVLYTLEGDANLDGVIDAQDYFRIDQGYLNGRSRYQDGDFDYDMTVGPDDYMLIDAAFAQQFAKSRQAAAQLVPEPGALLLLGAATALMSRRRRRQG